MIDFPKLFHHSNFLPGISPGPAFRASIHSVLPKPRLGPCVPSLGFLLFYASAWCEQPESAPRPIRMRSQKPRSRRIGASAPVQHAAQDKLRHRRSARLTGRNGPLNTAMLLLVGALAQKNRSPYTINATPLLIGSGICIGARCSLFTIKRPMLSPNPKMVVI